MRAVAVIAVLLYHAALGPFRGGYIGVDVFFVVSGYLITGVLLTEIGDGVRVLPRFWARRARRLLPASAIVLVTTVIVGRFVLDPLTQRSLAHDAVAAAVFVVNIVFARRDSDYFSSHLSPSPLLHFWTLAVEEQFYLLWPLLLLAFKRVRRHRTLVLLLAIGALWVASFVASIVVTKNHGPWAFYLLPTRAWELLSGAVVAVVGRRVASVLTPAGRAVLGWAGVVAVATAAMMLGGRSDFPGWIAIWPVAGTVAIVVAGTIATRHGPAHLLSSAPLVWIGRRSYGIYLWHWPALVLTAVAVGPLALWQRFLVLCASVLLAAFTYRQLENRVRRSPWLAIRPRRGLLMGAGLVACALSAAAVSLSLPARLDSGRIAAPAVIIVPVNHSSSPATTSPPSTTTTPTPSVTPTSPNASPASPNTSPASPNTTGDVATVSTPPDVTTSSVSDTGAAVAAIVAANDPVLAESVLIHDVPANLRPTLATAARDKPSIYHDGCVLSDGQTTPPPCIYGDPAAAANVVLFGDSHAAQWFPALQHIAEIHHFRLEVLTKKGCPTADMPITRRTLNPECVRWRAAVAQRVATEHPSLIVMSASDYEPGGAAAKLDPDLAWRAGLDATLRSFGPSAQHVLVLGDTPLPSADTPSCVAAHLRSVERCVAARAGAVDPPRTAVEQDVARLHDAIFAGTSDWLCTQMSCPVILGDVLLYRDDNHLTTTASLLLAPYLEAALAPLLTGG
jgi:peptidoglycan/LPS O-acetylase OafA/YrhL